MGKKHNGEDVDTSRRSLGHWDVREIPYHMTGHKQWSQIVGIDLFNPVIFLLAWPDSMQETIADFTYNEGGSCSLDKQSPEN